MNLFILIIIDVIARLLPHLPNMTPVGAMALFTGAKFGVKRGVIVTMTTMIITDMIIGLHTTIWATWGCLLISVFLGKLINKNNHLYLIASMTGISALIFFIVTNFAVWLAPNTMYSKNIVGLLDCYIAAVPFFRNSIIGDFFYTFILFAGFEIVRNISQSYLVLKK